MVLSSSNNYSKSHLDVVKVNNDKKDKLIRLIQNGQIQIYQSPYRGSYSSVIRDSLRNAALGRKVLLAQLMKGVLIRNYKCSETLWEFNLGKIFKLFRPIQF